MQKQSLTIKNVCTLLFFTIIFYNATNAQVTYVNLNATGSNDGTSWNNAYNDLSDALAATTTGEIWIATGTYHPGGSTPSTLSVFTVSGSPTLYGGFAGTETSIAERDITANPTTLSGDLNNDDVVDNFGAFRDDNTEHVLVVDTLGTAAQILIDGFTIKGGHASDNSDLSEYLKGGAGLFSYTPLQVSNCIFEGNFANTGGGCLVAGGAASSSFNNCLFQHNMATSRSAGLYLREVSEVEIVACNFINNITTRGALYTRQCVGVHIDSCTFTQNVTADPDAFAGAFYNWNSTGILMEHCTFTGNMAGHGGAIYNTNRDVLDTVAMGMIIDNCTFENNTASNRGGAIRNNRINCTIMNCNFSGNSATATSGSIYNWSSDIERSIVMTNNTFSGESSEFAGSLGCFGPTATYTISECEFTSNQAFTSGGACLVGILSRTTFNDCIFEGNSANYGGGIYVQDDSTEVHFNGGAFIGNSAVSNEGGAINIAGSIPTTIDGVTFEANTANAGGAVYFSENDDGFSGAYDEDITLEVKNCFFNFNASNSFGGGLVLLNVDTEITNCAFVNNTCAGDAHGAAISNNSFRDTTTVNIYNNTFSDNETSLAAVSGWSDSTSNLTMFFQNNIFANPIPNYGIANGNPTFISNGGNLCSDDSMTDLLIHPADLNNLDPMFVDPDDFDYHLQEGSPCIGVGVADGAPTTDLEGNPRFETIDIGAYESPFSDPVGIKELILENNGMLQLYPNPASAISQIQLDNTYTGIITFKLINNSGQMLRSWQVEKNTTMYKELISCDDLPAGQYYLLARFDNSMVQTALIIL